MSRLNLDWSKYKRDSTLIVTCSSCNRRYYEITLEEYAKLLGYTWKYIKKHPHRILTRTFHGLSPPLWYLSACRHWLETLSDHLITDDGHSIRAFVKHIFTSGDQPDYFNSDLIFDFSKDWWGNFLREPQGKRSKEYMLNEIKHLETKL